MATRSRSPWLSNWDLLPLFLALLLAATLPLLMQGLPDPIPTHFDLRGNPNGWTPKAAYPWICFGLPAMVWALLLLTGRAFVGSDQDPEGRKAAAMVPLRGLTTTGILLLMGAVLLIPRFGPGILWAMLAVFLVLMVFGTVLLVRQLKRSLPEDGQDGCYRWGLFYVNAEDPRVWVPKRFGLGWTLNFARGLSWFMLILLLLPPALIIGFSFAH